MLTSLNWLDAAFVGIIILSAVASLFKGFIKEFVTMCTWVLAAWLAYRFGPILGQQLNFIQTEVLRSSLGSLIILLGILLAGYILNIFVGRIIQLLGIKTVDRVVGFGFGVVRGVMVIMLFSLLTLKSSLKETPWWQGSYLAPKFETMTTNVIARLPTQWTVQFQALLEDFTL